MTATSIRYEKDGNNIVHLIMDRQNGSANIMDEAFQNDFGAITARLVAEADDIKGVIFRSAQEDLFCWWGSEQYLSGYPGAE